MERWKSCKNYSLILLVILLSGCGSINYHAKVKEGDRPEHSMTWDIPLIDFNKGWKELLDR